MLSARPGCPATLACLVAPGLQEGTSLADSAAASLALHGRLHQQPCVQAHLPSSLAASNRPICLHQVRTCASCLPFLVSVLHRMVIE